MSCSGVVFRTVLSCVVSYSAIVCPTVLSCVVQCSRVSCSGVVQCSRVSCIAIVSRIVLSCVVQCCCAVPSCVMRCHRMSCSAVVFRVVLSCVVSCSGVVPCCRVLCHIVLSCVISCCRVQSHDTRGGARGDLQRSAAPLPPPQAHTEAVQAQARRLVWPHNILVYTTHPSPSRVITHFTCSPPAYVRGLNVMHTLSAAVKSSHIFPENA